MARPTIYQSLTSFFNGGNTNTQKNVFSGDKELIKATSPSEASQKILQMHQDMHLKNQWEIVENDKVQKSMQYEITRYASYSDFEAMEFFPEIAAAIEIFMEEATTAKNGKILNIHSESSRIKTILEDLFYNRLKVNVTLPMWVRNLVKYGDNFLLLDLNSTKGITDCKQMPNYEIERQDGDILSNYRKGASGKTKFIWKERSIAFNEFQIAHFRLFGDDRKLPYGTSVLEKCRRIYKQLLLAEDAMLVYRVTRAPERRVYKIYVGNIDDKDVPAYITSIANKFKRTNVIDPGTGQIDVRYNTASNDQDYFIPVRDENAPNPIDTLPGASNLDAIADIEYLQRKLCIALRIPKTFLGFDDSVGEGKNLSLMDVRFSRTVNRIQQAIIQELNKIAIIHLYLLGFNEDLGNFKLTMNNPSSAADMLEIEELQTKTQVIKDLVSDAGDGFKVMSRTRALQEVFKWSEEEILEDLLKMRMEKAAAAELEGTTNIIKYTGVFDKVDRIYGDLEAAKSGKGIASDEEGGDDFGGSGGSGFGGGADFGGGDFEGSDADFGEDSGDDFGGDGSGEDFEGDEITDDIDSAFESLNEELRNKLSLITENNTHVKNNYKNKLHIKKMDYFNLLKKEIQTNNKNDTDIHNNNHFIKNLNESIDELNNIL